MECLVINGPLFLTLYGVGIRYEQNIITVYYYTINTIRDMWHSGMQR